MTDDEKKELKQALISDWLEATEDLAFLVEKAKRLARHATEAAQILTELAHMLKFRPENIDQAEPCSPDPVLFLGQGYAVALDIRKQKAVVRGLEDRKKSLGLS